MVVSLGFSERSLLLFKEQGGRTNESPAAIGEGLGALEPICDEKARRSCTHRLSARVPSRRHANVDDCRDNHTAVEARELSSREFDIVLASDCLYDSAMFAAFRRALAATCGLRTILLMAYKRRHNR